MQPPIHCRALNSQYPGSFHGPQALTPQQVKRFAFLFRQAVDYFDDSSSVRSETGWFPSYSGRLREDVNELEQLCATTQ